MFIELEMPYGADLPVPSSSQDGTLVLKREPEYYKLERKLLLARFLFSIGLTGGWTAKYDDSSDPRSLTEVTILKMKVRHGN